jgi:hypothetical protein
MPGPLKRATTLRWLAWVIGGTCVAIGLFHFDSRERFYGAIFLGYGMAWVWAARQRPIPSKAVRWLAGIFFVGGIGRVLSLVTDGRPQWFQLVLMAIELVLPPVYLWLSTADEHSEVGVRSARDVA